MKSNQQLSIRRCSAAPSHRSQEDKANGDGTTTRRYWKVFAWDVSKQVIGYLWIHVMNIAFAKWLSQQQRLGDECDWYLGSILVDTTIGTFLLWVLLQAVHPLLVRGGEATADLVDFGNYKGGGTEIQINIFIKQLGLWLVICTVMKLLMVVLMAWTKNELINFPIMLLSDFKHNPDEKLFAAMDFMPIIMNAFQLLVVDSFIAKPRMSPGDKVVVDSFQAAQSVSRVSSVSSDTDPSPVTQPLIVADPPAPEPKVRLEGVDDFLDANGLMSKSNFLRFTRQKVNIRYGFQTLQHDDIQKFYNRMSPSQGRADDIKEDQVERAFKAQRKLVDIFNNLDVSQASKVSREEFKQACMKNSGMCALFGISSVDKERNPSRFDSQLENAMNYEIFPADSQSTLRFKDVHAYMHTRARLTMEEVIVRLKEFEQSQVLP